MDHKASLLEWKFVNFSLVSVPNTVVTHQMKYSIHTNCSLHIDSPSARNHKRRIADLYLFDRLQVAYVASVVFHFTKLIQFFAGVSGEDSNRRAFIQKLNWLMGREKLINTNCLFSSPLMPCDATSLIKCHPRNPVPPVTRYFLLSMMV